LTEARSNSHVAVVIPLALDRAARLLVERLDQLETRVREGDGAAWSDYLAIVEALAAVSPVLLIPERRGAFLTTAEMADRVGITSKTLLKHKAKGRVRPAIQHGKLIRWRGDEVKTI